MRRMRRSIGGCTARGGSAAAPPSFRGARSAATSSRPRSPRCARRNAASSPSPPAHPRNCTRKPSHREKQPRSRRTFCRRAPGPPPPTAPPLRPTQPIHLRIAAYGRPRLAPGMTRRELSPAHPLSNCTSQSRRTGNKQTSCFPNFLRAANSLAAHAPPQLYTMARRLQNSRQREFSRGPASC